MPHATTGTGARTRRACYASREMIFKAAPHVVALAVALAACSSDVEPISPLPAPTPTGTSTSPSGTDGGPALPTDGGALPTDGATPQGDGGQPSTGSEKPACKYQAHKTGLSSLRQAGGLAFSVYAPPRYDKNVGHTMVVLMHGQDSTGVPELEALWRPIADAEGLVLVAPQGSRPPTAGATGGNWAQADLPKVLSVMSEVDDCYNVLTKKHILWGFSAGTFYGYLLGLSSAGRFSGLAMGGANTSFARQNGVGPAQASWKIPVSHVHGAQDQNPISLTYQDRTDFQNRGHVFTLREHAGGHSITPAQVRTQFDDLKASVSP